jgi:hypothetical protein
MPHGRGLCIPRLQGSDSRFYEIGGVRAAYVEPVAVGDILPNMPLFLANGFHIMVPLEPTYQATWDASPEELRLAVETGEIPDPDAE